MTETVQAKLTRKDFQSDQEVRWCPGWKSLRVSLA